MTRRLLIAAGTSWLTLAALAGCGNKEQAQPLTSQSFFTPVVEEEPMSSVDQPGRIENNTVNVDLMQSPAERQKAGAPPSVRNVLPIVKEATERAASSASTDAMSPTTLPSTRPVVAAAFTPANGGFLTIGGVIAEVNGKPVYADEVLKELEPDLASKARSVAEAQFRNVAAAEIAEQVNREIRDELVFAAAERALDQRERDLADAMTAKWRQDRITEAGGSLEVARKRALEQGSTFDALVNEQYREHMAQVYYQKRIYPRIQVTASDMRRYYERNADREFTEHAQARFRLIKIEVKKIGNREEALKRAQDIREQALTQDFAELASATNHDESLRKAGGDVGFIDKGSFRLEDVEEAVWALEANGVSDIIDAGDAFYIAKLEQKRDGRVQQFEEASVQNKIRNKLWSEQFQVLREAEDKRLREQSIVTTDLKMQQPAVDMAMQKYPRWTAAR